jgi:hypothetical protein
MKCAILITFMFSSMLSLFAKEPGRFVTELAYRENRAKQAAMSPMTLEQLRKYGVTDQTELKLEYFFYTNSESKAAKLADVLKKKGYSVEHGPSASDKKVQVVTGWTEKMKMSEAVVVAWTEEMTDRGFAADCDFDGWGTNPKQ